MREPDARVRDLRWRAVGVVFGVSSFVVVHAMRPVSSTVDEVRLVRVVRVVPVVRR
ncbi:hypothetical protein ATK36_6164 [Amycolatopsis sulphurea]|uniref:Uncharacterized protein n=1 Tax=Amycolatopsis sulphurea TaxID=76022 RepID=A0A2A9FKE5_9PSEU|nr:hypothetical protein ATK36_6164 [Amycolatopsis sulphurea]